MNKNLKESLEKLGLNVNVQRTVYLLRTPNSNLLAVYHCYDPWLEEELWELELPNNNTVNCYKETEDLIEALTNYLNPKWRNK